MSDVLKPCPFCGSQSVYKTRNKAHEIMSQSWTTKDERTYQTWTIRCDCGVMVSAGACNSEHGGADLAGKEAHRKVVKVWNTRAESKPLTVDEIEQCLPPDIAINPSWNLRKCAEAIPAAYNLKPVLTVGEIMDYIDDAISGRDTVMGAAQAIFDVQEAKQ